MKLSTMWRGVQIYIVAASLCVHMLPLVWAQEPLLNKGQLDDVDPALHAAVQALIANDPEVAKDPELADVVRQVAEATVLDPRERAAVTNEVVAMHREGVDVDTVIPQEVRDAAREEFAKVQTQMQEQLETLRASDPDAAREMELKMQEGERAIQAFERGEEYTPSPEMVTHAEEMFHDWEADMVAQGAPQEVLDRARTEFAMWSEGGVMDHLLAGPAQGGETAPGQGGEGSPGAGGGMPSPEQLQAMVDSGQMSPEQFEMAKTYMEQGTEGFGRGPGEFEQYAQGPSGSEYQGSPMEMFHEWSATEGQNVSPEQLEQYREMAEQYQQEFEQNQPENQNYDNLQQQQFDQSQPPPGGTPPPPPEVLVAVHDHDSDGIPDEYHYDTNGDGVADHAHPTPH